ncbi:5-formyltetrahydrofolate cyclo-ligase [Melampsora americana]|nr:5-formyltetrahydrofolate cyclo-ligase [Melampsora americana]
MNTSSTIINLKSTLRNQIKKKLSNLNESIIQEESKSVCKLVKESNWFKSSNKIGIYLSKKHGEIRTDELIKLSFSLGKEVYVPYCLSKIEMRMLRLENESDFLNLNSNRWGIREPIQLSHLESVDESLDLILIPGLGFDRSGGRLGHGRGYYDRYLSKLKSNSDDRSPFLVGLALSDQILPSGLNLPTSEHDHPLNLLVAPEGLIHFTHPSS